MGSECPIDSTPDLLQDNDIPATVSIKEESPASTSPPPNAEAENNGPIHASPDLVPDIPIQMPDVVAMKGNSTSHPEHINREANNKRAPVESASGGRAGPAYPGMEIDCGSNCMCDSCMERIRRLNIYEDEIDNLLEIESHRLFIYELKMKKLHFQQQILQHILHPADYAMVEEYLEVPDDIAE